MKTRVISSVAGLAILLPVLWFSDTPVLNIALAAVTVYTVWEGVTATGYYEAKRLFPLFGAFAMLTPFLMDGYSLYAGYAVAALIMLTFVFLIFNFPDFTVQNVAVLFFIAAYISLFLSAVVLVRRRPGGEFYMLLIFIGAWVSDSFAFTTGSRYGKRKLIPNISPNKTVEGAIGAVVADVIAFILFGLVMKFVFSRTPDYIALALLAVVCSVAGQMGDLAASIIKRSFGIKDFGNIMPGHGGLLDRIDSVLFTAPVIFLATSFFDFI